VKAADTIATPGIGRVQGFCAALFIARRTSGADRISLLEECGLLEYESVKLTARGCQNTIINYERPGH
jgi:hypothetical protein